ncbi:MAG: hypothetical protein ABIL09_20265 [Gemmatimonadota bacterium]
MPEPRSFDTRSAVLGAILGIVCLLALAAVRDRAGRQSGPPPVPPAGALAERGTPGPRGPMAPPARAERPGLLDGLMARQRLERAIEQRVQEHLDQVIGRNRSQVSLRVIQWDKGSPVPEALGLSMALSIDATKVTYDPASGRFVEIDRPPEEIEQLTELAKAAAGFAPGRHDQIAVMALRYDKSQEVEARRRDESADRRSFWGGAAKALLALVGLGLIAGRAGGRTQSGPLGAAEIQIAALVSAGAVLAAVSTGTRGSGSGWAEIGAFFGLFMLLAGLLAVVRWVRAPAEAGVGA